MFTAAADLCSTMQDFIDNKIYVLCTTKEEVDRFLDVCDSYGLKYSSRWPVKAYLKDKTNNAKITFVYNWTGASRNDGVSY